MNFGFLGIQFGWGLQMANMSPIYKYLGAADEQIAKLWLAAPLTGLLVQPIVGAMSDRTWGWLGRRRPYFLIGAILSTIALLLMPNAGSLAEWLIPHLPKFYMAAGLLWVLDASINISMEPFRAFVADKLPEEQRGTGFAMQSFFIGVGAVVAGLLPWMLRNWFGVSPAADGANALPLNVKISFYVGAAAFLTAVLWTVISTKEEPPADMEAFRRKKSETKGIGPLVREIGSALAEMPTTMRRLAVVQFFTWMGLFCMWLHFSNAVPVIFGSGDPSSDLFKRGAEWAGVCYATKDAVTFLAAFVLMAAARKLDRRWLHAVCLVLGAVGLLAVGFIHGEEQRFLLLGALALGGIAWASILSMPYAILSGALPPERMGVYMGIFNFFIVLPEILAALFFGGIVKHVLHGNLVWAVMAGGGFMLLAAAALAFVPAEPRAEPAQGAGVAG
ncbi:MFS transporter [Opitutus sp. ER46]|uniref:MFS transporter n=1 Tax=Opitutus sp. ER46 TaxID=2161864 RepID=UPI000D2FCAFA|nr:MFS transporter [Opitutus sp. ER46]PTX91010.1 MFS transporter [Opitutus sp. ER46]